MFLSPLEVVVKLWMVAVELQVADEGLVIRIGTPCRTEGPGRSVNGDASVTNEARPILDVAQQEVVLDMTHRMVI